MPGGRLTDTDRRDIASGLAEGLGYAEIARRLGRPTSTISREVSRNGGPGGYRADRAQEATGRRASRRGAAASRRAAAVPDAYGRDPEAVRSVVERFAELIVESGTPRMPARVLVSLITTDAGVLTAAELVERLRVSPASVSKAIGYLEGLELIRRERGEGRRERYVIDDDVWVASWTANARMNAMWAESARQAVELFGAETPAGRRLAELGRFFGQLSADMLGGSVSEVFADVLTVAAALVHAGRPLPTGRLAAALGWSPERVADAVERAAKNPDVTDPVAVRTTAPDVHTAEARPGRLTRAQRDALCADPRGALP